MATQIFFYLHAENWGNDPIWRIFFKWVETHQLERDRLMNMVDFPAIVMLVFAVRFALLTTSIRDVLFHLVAVPWFSTFALCMGDFGIAPMLIKTGWWVSPLKSAGDIQSLYYISTDIRFFFRRRLEEQQISSPRCPLFRFFFRLIKKKPTQKTRPVKWTKAPNEPGISWQNSPPGLLAPAVVC